MTDYHELTVRGRARRLRAVLTAALAHYDLDIVRTRLITNETNGIFRIDTSDRGRYAVRVGLGGPIGHAADMVRAETEWLLTLAARGGVTVPVPVRTRKGDPFVTVQVPGVPDARNVVVFTWLDGALLGGRLSTDSVQAYGALSARLHAHGAGHVPSTPAALARYDRVFPFDEPVVLFDAEDALMQPARRAVFEAAAAQVELEIATLRDGGEPMRVLHGDLHPWNVMTSRGRLAPFDFEDMMWGWPVQDIATSLYYLRWRPEFPEWAAAFRAGYETIAAWPEQHDGQIETFMIGRSLVLANDLLVTPEWRGEASAFLTRYEERLSAFLARRRAAVVRG